MSDNIDVPPLQPLENIVPPPVEQINIQSQEIEQNNARSSVVQQGDEQHNARSSVVQQGNEQNNNRSSVVQQEIEQNNNRSSVVQQGSEQNNNRSSVVQQGGEQNDARSKNKKYLSSNETIIDINALNVPFESHHRVRYDHIDELLDEQCKDIVFFNDMCTKNNIILSSSLDILAVYLKGQKILYTEAKVYCETQLNSLMLPAIAISAFCTVLSLALKGYDFNAILISSLAAFNSFVLSLISYLKLDAKAEAHKTSAYQYDKLQESTEFMSGRVMFFNKDRKKVNLDEDNMEENVYNLVKDIEKKVAEIKEMNKFILPEYIRHNYHKLYSQNIFSVIKTIQTEEVTLKANLQRLLNKMVDSDREFEIKIKEAKKQLEYYNSLIVGNHIKVINHDVSKVNMVNNNIIYHGNPNLDNIKQPEQNCFGKCLKVYDNKEEDEDDTKQNYLYYNNNHIIDNVERLENLKSEEQDYIMFVEIRQKQKYYDHLYYKLMKDRDNILEQFREGRSKLLLKLVQLQDKVGVETKEIKEEIGQNVIKQRDQWCNCFTWLKT